MFFRLLPGVEPLPLEDGSILFVSDWVRMRLEGASASTFAHTLLPLLQDWRGLEELLATWPGAAEAELTGYLNELCEVGVMQRSAAQPSPTRAHRLLDTVAALGVDAEAAAARLATMRIVVFGVEDIGAHLIAILRPWGLGELVVADPFPLQPGNRAQWPFAGAKEGRSRQEALVQAWGEEAPGLVAAPEEPLTREGVAALAQGADLLIGCFDRGFSAAHHWINRAALSGGMPAVFASSSGVRALVGPWVFPGETACHMCWRMRSIAAQPSFDKTMAYEQHTDRQRRPAGATRPCLPGLVEMAAGLLASEIATTMLGLAVPAIANAVIEIDALEKTQQRHRFLHRPDCPHCQGLYKAVRSGGTLP